MIVNVIDIKHNAERARRIAATLAGFMAYNGSNVLVLQFEDYTQDSIEKILFHEYKGSEGYGMEFKRNDQSGMDGLFLETSLNKISVETFYDNVEAYGSKSRRFDVAAITQNSGFVAMLDEKQQAVTTLLTSADAVYDYVFISYGGGEPGTTFGAYTSEIQKLIKFNVLVARQGEWVHPDRDYQSIADAIYISTEFDIESELNLKVCAKRLNVDYRKIYPLATPVAYRDAADTNKLISFIRTNRNAAQDAMSDAVIWAQNLMEIMAALGGSQKKVPEDLWGTWEARIGYVEFPDAE